MLIRRYVTVDVFTRHAFGGNPLAVVLDAEGLTAVQMQSIATEFNYSETTFVWPAQAVGHTAQVRIFTPRIEVPFAGHPNVGTAVVLAQELESKGAARRDEFIFEEAAGLVRIRLIRDGDAVVAAEFTAPERLSIRSTVSRADAAACLSLADADICVATHPPQVVSVGLPFLVVEVVSRDALSRARPDIAAHERVLPPAGTDAVFAYTRGETAGDLHARNFAPLDACMEDPATGSATAATISLLASLSTDSDGETSWRIEQGVDMGRPSLLLGRTEKRGGVVTAVHLAGFAVTVMQGTLHFGGPE
ncbi:MAG TPA: PhzF family phenazine biosynthesis protein [Steroidobacteraceae bacterium]|jgi:trans-2,3-dihydro-3-hydroxyanthranilate isomerase|nr:PhzF family phenazine biosynthesis protein [Steroidobacteraceae bacterium]